MVPPRLRLGPNLPAPHRDYAVFLGSLGRPQDSIKWLQKAATLAPQNAEIPFLTALAHAETGNTAKALQLLEKATRLDPLFARAWYNLGLLLSSENRPQEAIQALYKAEQANPSDPSAPYARATIHLRLGQTNEAVDAAREALFRQPGHGPSIQLLQQLGL